MVIIFKSKITNHSFTIQSLTHSDSIRRDVLGLLRLRRRQPQTNMLREDRSNRFEWEWEIAEERIFLRESFCRFCVASDFCSQVRGSLTRFKIIYFFLKALVKPKVTQRGLRQASTSSANIQTWHMAKVVFASQKSSLVAE